MVGWWSSLFLHLVRPSIHPSIRLSVHIICCLFDVHSCLPINHMCLFLLRLCVYVRKFVYKSAQSFQLSVGSFSSPFSIHIPNIQITNSIQWLNDQWKKTNNDRAFQRHYANTTTSNNNSSNNEISMGRFIDILVDNLLKYAIHWPIAMFKSQFINRRTNREREEKNCEWIFKHSSCNASVCSFHGWNYKIKM